jgi:oxygen-independent coproporphyrinogen-3 oxidase
MLAEADMRRRYIIQSLLQADGLDRAAYRGRFASDALADQPQLYQLVEHGLATLSDTHLLLTESGLERSDAIGPWLYTAQVQALMEAYELR